LIVTRSLQGYKLEVMRARNLADRHDYLAAKFEPVRVFASG
jgi:hypothetical protein